MHGQIKRAGPKGGGIGYFHVRFFKTDNRIM